MLESQQAIITKTRLAPTPSGYLHLGNILSFGITAALAKKHGAKILLRIDDLDKVRANPLYVKDIFDTLNFLGIGWDEGPRNMEEFENAWSQLTRMTLYNQAIVRLKTTGKLFVSTCSRTNYNPKNCNCQEKGLPFETSSANWRIKTDKCQVGVKAYGGNMVREDLPDDLQNFIVRKKDGYPSYQLASVIDDLYYGIDLIVRGNDLWPSTIAQHYLAEQLIKPEFSDITFYHHPLIKDTSNQKLSKSAGSTSIKHLREEGFSAADILSKVAILTGSDIQIKDWQHFLEFLLESYLK